MRDLGKFTMIVTLALSLFACSKEGGGGQAPLPPPQAINQNFNRQILPNGLSPGIVPTGQFNLSRDITNEGRIINKTIVLVAGESDESIVEDTCRSGRQLSKINFRGELSGIDQKMQFSFDGSGNLTISLTSPAGTLTSQAGSAWYQWVNDRTLQIENFILYGVPNSNFIAREVHHTGTRQVRRSRAIRDYGYHEQQSLLFSQDGYANGDQSRSSIVITSPGFSAYLTTSKVTPQDSYPQHIDSARVEKIPMKTFIDIADGPNYTGCYETIQGETRGHLQ